MEEFDRISGGLAWPTLEAPAYFCIFGQSVKENQFGKRPLIQVFELENIEDSIDIFFKQIKKASDRLRVDLIYGNSEHNAFTEKAFSYGLIMPQKLSGMQDFNYGLEIIKAWAKAHAIETMEDSILRSQLISLRDSELKEAPEKFNAINGLRYAVTGFDDREDGRPLSDNSMGDFNLESIFT